jgi:hypothetical protein
VILGTILSTVSIKWKQVRGKSKPLAVA